MSFVPLVSFVQHACYSTHRPGTGGLISLLTGEQPAAQPTQTLIFGNGSKLGYQMTQIRMVIFSWKPSIWSINNFGPYPFDFFNSQQVPLV